MSMMTNLYGIVGMDNNRFLTMKKVLIACSNAKVDIPYEVEKYFGTMLKKDGDSYSIQDGEVRIALPKDSYEVSPVENGGFTLTNVQEVSFL